MKLAPVVLFTFNRPDHTKKTLEALAANEFAEHTNLYVFSDGPRNDWDLLKINKVREIIYVFEKQQIFLNFQVFEREKNKGLANSVIDGVSQVFLEYDSVIVLEDDLITSSDFIKYMNDALVFYKDSDAGSVTGYNPLKISENEYSERTYAIPRNCSFGWGTWKNIWNEIDWDVSFYDTYRKKYFQRRKFNQTGFDRSIRLDRQMEKNVQSWSIRFGFNLFHMNKLSYYPVKSKIIPNGWDGSGVHSTSGIGNFNTEIEKCTINEFKKVGVDQVLLKKFRKLYGGSLKSELKEFLFWMKNLIK
jgi:hypothetical protein